MPQTADHGQVDAFDRPQSVGVQVHEIHGLAVGALTEGVRQRRTRVADVLGEGLRRVKVAQRDVVDIAEGRRRHRLDTADGDRPFGSRGLGTHDECVGQHHGPGARTGVVARVEVGADAIHRGVEDLGVRAGGRHVQLRAGDLGFEVGDAVERDGTVRVLEHDG